MDDQTAGEKGPRTPTPADLDRIANSLNEHGVRYVVVGGFAIQRLGFQRPTHDIDLLVDARPENVERIRQALCVLEDNAALEIAPGDLEAYSVVRVADEIVVDLLARAAGLCLDDVEADIEYDDTTGIRIPYLSPAGLLRTKETLRPKDAVDREFLERVLSEDSPV